LLTVAPESEGRSMNDSLHDERTAARIKIAYISLFFMIILFSH
jgi:hypothetical protein